MDAPMHNERTLGELLATVERALSADDVRPDDCIIARDNLRQAAATLADLQSADWAAAAGLLADLLDVAGLSLDDADVSGGAPLCACVAQGVSLLRAALEDPDAGAQRLAEYLESTRRDWADCLTVVDGAGAIDEEFPTENDIADDVDVEAEAAPSADQVQMILRALGGGETSTNLSAEPQDSAADAPPRAFESTSSDAGPPMVLPRADTSQIDPELLEAYLSDVGQCLGCMERAILDFENGGGEAPLGQLCRELHTLKGASASVGLSELAEYLHRMEEWLQAAVDRNGQLNSLDAVLACVDLIREQVLAQPAPRQSPPAADASPGSAPRPATSAAGLGGGDVVDGEESLRVKSAQVDRLMDLLADLVMIRSRRDGRVAQLGNSQEELGRCIARLQVLAEDFDSGSTRRPAEKADADGAARSPGRSYLAEIAGDLAEVARSLKELHDPIAGENRTISQFIRQFRHELMELRRLPVSGLFRRLQRAVRDAARVEGKQVRLELIGEHAGLERSLQERLYEPLLHMVRNAVSHGIEAEAERVAAGKDAVGTITLEALGSAQVLVLEIRDDGKGLDFDAIRRRGIQRGLISADDHASQAQLAQLIFQPGFSTREQANSVAGRGVGMDVVASVLQRLHARIEIDSHRGEGTTIRLRIPLRSVIEHTMLFRCGGQLFALPVQSVRATLDDDLPSIGELRPAVEKPGFSDCKEDVPERRTHFAPGRGRANPKARLLTRLADVLNLPVPADVEHERRLVLRSSNLSPARKAGGSGGSVTVLVDEIIGPEEVVVRSLPAALRRHPLLAGATLSGGGEVVLLLDSDATAEACAARSTEAEGRGASATGAGDEDFPAALKVLVVDDSLSARRSLMQKLRKWGFELREAGDGFEALDLLRAERFDLVFTDLEMPRMGGFDLLAEIRGNRRTRALQVVVVTSRSEDAFRSRAAELDADGYLTKPVSEPALAEMLEQLEAVQARTVPVV